jgi:tetratricopeptide (TPR) repeat protein
VKPRFTDPAMTDPAIEAAISALEIEAATPAERIEKLIDMAQQLQAQASSLSGIERAVYLYCQALELCEEGVFPLQQAQALVGLGAALRAFPAGLADPLLEARVAYQKALPLLQEHGTPEAVAAAEMALGLVLQGLVPFGLAELSAVLHSYQRALRVYTGERYPKEHAIVQNNIAIACLAMPLSSQPDDRRYGLVMQAFEQALKYLSWRSHPQEYAMLQNNLGNALQYSFALQSAAHSRRALSAYDEAIRVRRHQGTPLEMAHTLANKANLLFSLPDDDDRPEGGNRANLDQAKALYQEAQAIFQQQGQPRQAGVVADALADVEQALQEQTGSLE